MAWYQNLFLNFIKYPTKWLVKTSNIPTDIEGELGINKDRPIIYLLKTNSATDQVALEISTKMLGLPAPDKSIVINDQKHPKLPVFGKASVVIYQTHQTH